MLSRLAQAKVNLYLHVAAPDQRGYHPLQSLVMFADIGDEVVLREPGAGRLVIEGKFGQGLSAGADNLVIRAATAFQAATGRVPAFDLYLRKDLPVASGLGGGSADAGAVLHLLRDACAPDMADADLEAMAARLGADGVMCLWSRTAFAEGYGEVLTPVDLPKLPCVLVNPGVICATPAVFHGFDQLGRFAAIDACSCFRDVVTFDGLIAALKVTRNDLEPAAIVHAPVIADVLSQLEAQPETRMARMSGSGATCFALCDSIEAAGALSRRMQAFWPAAWITACTLG